MASERIAKRAAEIHQASLRALGARHVEVDRVGRERRKTYGIVALFDNLPSGVPKSVDVQVARKVVAVPVVVKVDTNRPR